MKLTAAVSAGLIGLGLAACGGGTKTVVSTRTVTQSPMAPPLIAQRTPCPHITTNNCDFAQAVVAAFRGSWVTNGHPPDHLTVRTSPVACTAYPADVFYCRNQRPIVALKFRMHQPQASAPTSPPAATPPPATSSPSSSATQSFRGNGAKKLGTIEVSADSTLKWTNDGDLFQILDATGVEVNSQAHSGTSDLSAGSYTDVQIDAIGNWTIEIVPK